MQDHAGRHGSEQGQAPDRRVGGAGLRGGGGGGGGAGSDVGAAGRGRGAGVSTGRGGSIARVGAGPAKSFTRSSKCSMRDSSVSVRWVSRPKRLQMSHKTSP